MSLNIFTDSIYEKIKIYQYMTFQKIQYTFSEYGLDEH